MLPKRLKDVSSSIVGTASSSSTPQTPSETRLLMDDQDDEQSGDSGENKMLNQSIKTFLKRLITLNY